MSVFDYSTCIKMTFDRPIISEIGAATGTEYSMKNGTTAIASGRYSATYDKSLAFDASTSTYWRAAATTAGQWIGTDFGQSTTLAKISAYFGYSAGRPNGYIVQGSNDSSNWFDIISGSFSNVSAWQDVTFEPTTYRYWRLYFSSRYSSYYTCSELRFYELRTTYDTAGWVVSAQQPDMVPGQLSEKAYTVRRVTKSEDNMSVFLWLDLVDRFKYPVGQITVNFTGSMFGIGNAPVLAFTAYCNWLGVPVFNPNDAEYIEIANITATAVRIVVNYLSAQAGSEYIGIVAITSTAVRTHIDDLGQ